MIETLAGLAVEVLLGLPTNTTIQVPSHQFTQFSFEADRLNNHLSFRLNIIKVIP